jgi:hypothetical protein
LEEREYMILHSSANNSQLFTLRVWPEEVSEGRVEWRGKIQRVIGGETLIFHNWEVMLSFLLQTLEIDIPATHEPNQRRESDA